MENTSDTVLERLKQYIGKEISVSVVNYKSEMKGVLEEILSDGFIIRYRDRQTICHLRNVVYVLLV